MQAEKGASSGTLILRKNSRHKVDELDRIKAKLN